MSCGLMLRYTYSNTGSIQLYITKIDSYAYFSHRGLKSSQKRYKMIQKALSSELS